MFRRITFDRCGWRRSFRGKRRWRWTSVAARGLFWSRWRRKHPERNYLGTERLLGRVRNTCRKAERAGVTNVRLLRVESAYVVRHLLPPGTVSRFYVLFPDPWPKRRHWPRRLIQPEFLDAAAMALTPGGELCIKTDDADYFRLYREGGVGVRAVRQRSVGGGGSAHGFRAALRGAGAENLRALSTKALKIKTVL